MGNHLTYTNSETSLELIMAQTFIPKFADFLLEKFETNNPTTYVVPFKKGYSFAK